MSKIVISCASMYNGGAERVLSNLSYAFADHYDEVEYITWVKYPVSYQIDSRVVLNCAEECAKTTSVINRMKWFRKHIKEVNPDLVVSLLTPFNILTMLSLLFSGKRVIVCERNDSKRLKLKGGVLTKWLRNLLYYFSDGILTQTESNLQTLPWFLRKKASVIYNPMIMGKDYIGKALITPKKDVIVTVGRLVKAKNHEMLVRAFKGVLEKFPSYELHIYGTGDNKEALAAYINDLGLSGSVKLMGSVKNIWDYLVSAKIYAFSSNYEGMPNALMEALCLGLPCVTTKVSGAVDVIVSYKNGILVDVNDEDGMRDAIIKFIENPEIAYKLGENATSLYDMLEYKKINQQWLDYIDDKIAR